MDQEAAKLTKRNAVLAVSRATSRALRSAEKRSLQEHRNVEEVKDKAEEGPKTKAPDQKPKHNKTRLNLRQKSCSAKKGTNM